MVAEAQRWCDPTHAEHELRKHVRWLPVDPSGVARRPVAPFDVLDVHDPVNWATYDQAQAASEGNEGWHAGFVLDGSGIVAVISDGAADSRMTEGRDGTGGYELRDRIRSILSPLYDHVYSELMPNGVACWAKAHIRSELTWPRFGITIRNAGVCVFTGRAINAKPIEDIGAEIALIVAQLTALEPPQLTDNFIEMAAFDSGSDQAQVEYAIGQLVPCGMITRIRGVAGHGKSTLASAMCATVATGAPFLDLPTTRRKILYLDQENPDAGVKDRLQRLGIKRSRDFLYLDNHFCNGVVPQPSDQVVCNFIDRTDPKPMLVIDSYLRFFQNFFDGKCSENDSVATSRWFAQLNYAKNAGCPIVVLDHTGEDLKSRGSTDKEAAIDVDFTLWAKLTDDNLLDVLTLRNQIKARVPVVREISVRYEGGILKRCPQPQHKRS
jgi:hypothetical protein